MPTKGAVKARREQVAQYMRRSINSPTLIAKALSLNRITVENDVKFLRKNSRTWLTELAVDGLVFETQMGVEAMQELEKNLQNMLEQYKTKYNEDGSIKQQGDPQMVLRITAELRELINTRLETLANGPTLAALRGGTKPDNG